MLTCARRRCTGFPAVSNSKGLFAAGGRCDTDITKLPLNYVDTGMSGISITTISNPKTAHFFLRFRSAFCRIPFPSVFRAVNHDRGCMGLPPPPAPSHLRYTTQQH